MGGLITVVLLKLTTFKSSLRISVLYLKIRVEITGFFSILATMNFFNQLYLTVFNRFKGRYKQKANTIALFYTSVLQIALLFLGGVFFIKFLEQMKVVVMSSSNTWIVFVLTAVFIHFKNWVNYSGRKRRVLNAKLSNKKDLGYSTFILIVLPIAIIALSVLFYKAV